jgi:hypothetical protein
MKRILEPELMDDEHQAVAYAQGGLFDPESMVRGSSPL